MDGVLFEEWVKEMDKKFASEERRVALVMDNCLHKIIRSVGK